MSVYSQLSICLSVHCFIIFLFFIKFYLSVICLSIHKVIVFLVNIPSTYILYPLVCSHTYSSVHMKSHNNFCSDVSLFEIVMLPLHESLLINTYNKIINRFVWRLLYADKRWCWNYKRCKCQINHKGVLMTVTLNWQFL